MPRRSEVLQALQRAHRSKMSDQSNLLEDIINQAKLMQLDTEMSETAVAGLLFDVWRLYGTLGTRTRPEELAEMYAAAELTSYAQSEQEVERIRHWAARNGLVLKFLATPCPDNSIRYMAVSIVRQTSFDGKHVYLQDEMVPNPLRDSFTVAELVKELEEKANGGSR